MKSICPDKGGVYGDKGYCTKSKGCHVATIKKKNMKGKNKELDKWYSHLRFLMSEYFLK